VRLGTWSKALRFGSLMGIVSPSFSAFVLGTQPWLLYFHSFRFFFYWLIMIKKIISWMLEWWLTIWLGGVVFPLTLWRVVIIIPVLFIVLGLGYVLIRIRLIWHTRLVKVMIYWVGNIWVKIGRGVTCIIIKIGKTVVISHITQEISKTNKEKQTNAQKRKIKPKLV